MLSHLNILLRPSSIAAVTWTFPISNSCVASSRLFSLAVAGTQMQVDFVASSELGQSKWDEPQQYDAVTCMFAIHYFFVSEAALRQLLENVVNNLKAGMPSQNAQPAAGRLYLRTLCRSQHDRRLS